MHLPILALCVLPPTACRAAEWTEEFRADAAVTCLAEGAGGALFAGDAKGRVWRFDGEQPQELHTRPDHRVTCLLADPNGVLWVGWDDGVSRMTPGDPPEWDHWNEVFLEEPMYLGFRYRSDEPGEAMGEVTFLVRTARGVQAGTRDRGLISWTADARLWEIWWPPIGVGGSPWINLQELLPGAPVHCVLQDPLGNIWFGTAEGIFLLSRVELALSERRSGYYARLDEGTRPPPPGTRFTPEADGIPPGGVTAMAADAEGGVWFGFGGDGDLEHRSRDGTWHATALGGGPRPIGAVAALAVDGDSQVWVTCKADAAQQSLLYVGDGTQWQGVEPSDPAQSHWEPIHGLVCSPTGKLLVVTGNRVLSTPVAPPSVHLPAPLEAPPVAADADEPVDLPSAAEPGVDVGEMRAEDLLATVVERNWPWLLPTVEGLTSLEYTFTLDGPGIQQRVRWEAPNNLIVEGTWDRDGLCPGLMEHRWVSFDGQVWEQGPEGIQPLSTERFDGGLFWQDILIGLELQTALRQYARDPAALLASRPGRSAEDTGAVVVRIEPPEAARTDGPYAAARLFWMAWNYGIMSSGTWAAEVRIDRARLVPTAERWLYKDTLMGEVRYGDFRETPEGKAVPMSVEITRFERDGKVRDTFQARFAWFGAGAWLMTDCAGDTEWAGPFHGAVSGVRTNRPGTVAIEVDVVAQDILGRQDRALDILTQMAEKCEPWLGAKLDPGFLEASYRFELRDKDDTPRELCDVSITAGEGSRWSPSYLGNTVGMALAPLAADPALYRLMLTGTTQHEGREVYVIRAQADDRVRVLPNGNGMGPLWYGYFTQAWRDLEVWVNAKTVLPVMTRNEDREQWFSDFEEVRPGQFAPMTIRTAGWFERHFIWANDCLWIATETISAPGDDAPHRLGRITNLRVNAEPVEGVPVLSEEEIKEAQAAYERAEAEAKEREKREREEEEREERDDEG